MREVIHGDKHNLRKSANRNAQISVIHSAYCTDLCFAICRYSQVVFVTSNNFTHNLLFYFQKFLIGTSLKRAPQLRVDLAFCHDIYIYIYIGIDEPTSIFDPAPGVKVGCCGQNLRVVTLCENDLLYWYMHIFLHIRLRIRHWSNFSEFSFCVRLSATVSTEPQCKKKIGLGKMPSNQRSRDFLLPQGQPESKHVLSFSDLLAPIEKPYSTKQRCYCNSLSCKLLPQLIDNSATKGFFFWQTTELLLSFTL